MILFIIPGTLILILLGYFLYVLLAYHRLKDHQPLEIEHGAQSHGVPLQQELRLLSYNIGFAAYVQDYSFFMDGGKYARAYSKESVLHNLEQISGVLLHTPIPR